MENQDKLHQQFKDAAGRAEDKGFDRMDAVWNRVEEKLDNKKLQKSTSLWKYTAMAAVFLLFTGVGFFMLNNENNTIVTPKTSPENNVTVIDTQKVKESFDPARASEINAFVTIEKTTKQAPVYKEAAPSKTEASAISESAEYESYDDAPLSKSYVATPVADMVADTDKKSEITERAISANKIVTGVITDSQGMPLPGAVVSVEGTRTGVSTDFDGKYMIDAQQGQKIIASYIGMESQSITLGNQKDSVNMQLADNSSALQEMVVQGYRNTKAQSNIAATTITSKAKKEVDNVTQIAFAPITRKIIPQKEVETSGINGSISPTTSFTDRSDKAIKNDTLIFRQLTAEQQLRNDIRDNKIKLYILGGIAARTYPGDAGFEEKYEVDYYDFGCLAPPQMDFYRDYNLLVLKYLTTKYGNEWQKDIRKDIMGWDKWEKKE